MSALVGIRAPLTPQQTQLVQPSHALRKQQQQLFFALTICGLLLIIVMMLTPADQYHEHAIMRFGATYKSELMAALAISLLYLSSKLSSVSERFGSCGMVI